MNILLINNGYPSSTNPQYSTYIKSIEECLRDAGMEVDLLVLDTNFKGKVSKYFLYLKFFVKLLLFRYKEYDFIYINNYPYCFFPTMFRIKKFKNIIIHWHGTDIISSGLLKRTLNNFSYRFLPHNHIAIVPSDYFKQEVIERLGINRFNKIFVSPSGGVDILKFFNSKKEVTDKIILGFASSLTSAKGADIISELGQNLSFLSDRCNVEIALKVIAYGAEKEYYLDRFKSSSEVTIEKPFPKEEMKNFYNSIDIFLFPTKRKAESLGLVGLEAMSCGKPVVGTNDFALKEYIIPGETGELFELGNYQDFEKAIIRTIKNLGNYKPRELVIEKYSKGAVGQQYKEIFNAISK
ncbi:MAG: hypothetical protein PWQ06_847 [Anaerophaga sp.]|nr:hypothetical protein [Anaerophaga sp.]